MNRTGTGDPRKTLELLWREWTDTPKRRGPNPRFTIDDILQAAVRIADDGGIDALSMRAIATELNVGTMSLYRHVPGKPELIDLLVDHIDTEGDELPDTSTMNWRDVLEILARHTLAQYRRHPWLLDIVQHRPVFGPRTMTSFDFALAAFDDHDIPERQRMMVITAVVGLAESIARAYMPEDPYGDKSAQSTEQQWWDINVPYLTMVWESGHYSRVSRLTDDSTWEVTGEEALEFSINGLLNGFAPLFGDRPTMT
ncbi:TetR/AcrR family transcriptional regulator [Haloglycomyces albus]|uniref:TetR/AcrR family transcriptional regulator n=1 Tax=Haloglycomyces albus TaxID=526067 RepID=UPI00046D1C3B|nr:TetR/AcrR family transcriptional regulator [Haloglycomyces albus]